MQYCSCDHPDRAMKLCGKVWKCLSCKLVVRVWTLACIGCGMKYEVRDEHTGKFQCECGSSKFHTMAGW